MGGHLSIHAVVYPSNIFYLYQNVLKGSQDTAECGNGWKRVSDVQQDISSSSSVS